MSTFKTKTFRFDLGETSLHEYISKLESCIPVWQSGEEPPTKNDCCYVISYLNYEGIRQVEAAWWDGDRWLESNDFVPISFVVDQWTDLPRPPL